MKTKFFLLLLTLLIIPFSASALVFSDFSGNVGSVNTANGFYDNDGEAYGYTGERNVYVVTEPNEIWIFEPICAASGACVGTGTASFQTIDGVGSNLFDAVVHGGYLYFVQGTTLYKRKTRAVNSVCNANDTAAGGCIQTITTNVGNNLRVYNNRLYLTVGGTSLRHLDENDNVILDFAISSPPNGAAQHGAIAVTTNGSDLQVYIQTSNPSNHIQRCTSSGCVDVYFTSGAATSQDSFFVTNSFFYAYTRTTGGVQTETLRYIANNTTVSVDYITTSIGYQNRIYVGGRSTLGLLITASNQYETFNSAEAGIDSLPVTSSGSGTVTYVTKDIDVPNLNYYNDSVIPINIALRFIISDANKTNYTSSIFWHVKINDPLGIQVFDLNLPGIACTQQTPWWDILGIFTSADWACDGSGSIEYTRTAGQFWTNGTYTVFLTEQLPGQTFILDFDTYNIVNQSSSNPGSVTQPPSCPTCGVSGTGTITIATALTIIAVLGQIAFWGLILWLGIIFTTIRIMTKNGASVSSHGLITVAWLAAVFIALVGLFGPYKIYVIVLSTIIAAVMFKFGKNATTGSE